MQTLLKRYKRPIIFVGLLLVVFALSHIPFPFSIENNASTYQFAVVTKVKRVADQPDRLTLQLNGGAERGKIVEASIGALTTSVDIVPPHYAVGDKVLVNSGVSYNGQPSYVVIDRFRLPFVFWLFVAIVVLATAFAGWRGIGSFAGLLLSLLIVGKFIVPLILHGYNPYLVTFGGILVISLLGIFIAHGFSKRTAIALLSTYITILIAVGLSWLVVHHLQLTGISSENVFYLSNKVPGLNVSGILLCGMIISIIGILDDMTVGQATAVEELHKANPNLSLSQLYRSGSMIGREHIASLINTLILAFVGTSFLFIFYISATTPYPLLVNLNSEQAMEEIARSLIGSAALILAVPISTILAARFLRPTIASAEDMHQPSKHRVKSDVKTSTKTSR